MARLPFAGGRQGMGTTAVENDFLNQLEEAHGAGDDAIAATLAGQPTAINPLSAMMVQNTRQEMREGSQKPPQTTVREDLAMNSMNQGLGSRPRSYQPPMTMAGGGVIPRYSNGSEGTPVGEEIDQGYLDSLLEYVKTNPREAAGIAASVGLMFVPIPGSRALGLARLATSPAGRIGSRLAKPVVNKAKSVFSRLKNYRDTKGEMLGKLANNLPPKVPQPAVRDMATSLTNPAAAGRITALAENAAARRAAVARMGNQDLLTKAGAGAALGYGLFGGDDEVVETETIERPIPLAPEVNPDVQPRPAVEPAPLVDPRLDDELFRLIESSPFRRNSGGLIPRYNTAGITGDPLYVLNDPNAPEFVAPVIVGTDDLNLGLETTSFFGNQKSPYVVDATTVSALGSGNTQTNAQPVVTEQVSVSEETQTNPFSGPSGDEYLRYLLNPEVDAERKRRNRASTLLSAASKFLQPGAGGGFSGGLDALAKGADRGSAQDMAARQSAAQSAMALARLRSAEGVSSSTLASREGIAGADRESRERTNREMIETQRQKIASEERLTADALRSRETNTRNSLQAQAKIEIAKLQSTEERERARLDFDVLIQRAQQYGSLPQRQQALTALSTARANGLNQNAQIILERIGLQADLSEAMSRNNLRAVQSTTARMEQNAALYEAAVTQALKITGGTYGDPEGMARIFTPGEDGAPSPYDSQRLNIQKFNQ